MSGYFDGSNERLSKTWRFRRSGRFVKTSRDFRNWEIFSFKRSSFRTGIVAVLPGKFLKSLRNRTPYRVEGLFGGTGGRYDTLSLWGLYKMHETLWFCLMSGLRY